MKKICSILAVLFLFAASAFAQQQPQQPQQQQAVLIGVVDLPSVFQKHPLIADNLRLIQEDVQKDSIELAKARQAAQKQLDALKQQFKIGSDEYNNQLRPIQESLQNKERSLQEKQTKIKLDVAKIQYKVYQDVKAAIEHIAYQKGIVAVFIKISIHQKDVMEELIALQELEANTIVWNRPECNITNDVLAVLAQTVGVPKNNSGSALNNISGQMGQTPANNTQGQQPGLQQQNFQR